MKNNKRVYAEFSENGHIDFICGDWMQAFNDGFFYLNVNKALNIESLKYFTKSFYLNHNLKESEIYFDRKGFQTEHLLISDNDWKEYLVDDVCISLNILSAILTTILSDSLKELGVSKEIWSIITGHAVDKKPLYWFAANHYRTKLNNQGCPGHKDTGFITLLHAENDGLEYAFLDKNNNIYWQEIKPVKDHLIVHFGESYERLTQKYCIPVKAIFHRVRKIAFNENKEDRHSFAVFINSFSDENLYELLSYNQFRKLMPVHKFLEDFNKSTWKDYHDESLLIILLSIIVHLTNQVIMEEHFTYE